MAVYVDDMKAAYRGMLMCHMIADTHGELLRMAARIGVQKRWLQEAGTYKEHFDVCQSKRKMAVAYGAMEITRELLVKIIAARRDAWLSSRIKRNTPSAEQEPPLTERLFGDSLVEHPSASDCATSEEKSKSSS